jgi:hypothetical protein
VARAPEHVVAPPTVERLSQRTESVPKTKTNTTAQSAPAEPTEQKSEPAKVAEKTVELPSIPENVPKVIPFPSRKKFQLVPSGTNDWVDAATSAVLQGEVAVGIVSAATKRLDVTRAGKTAASPNENVVIHVQVVLIGTTQKVEFDGWSGASFGDTRHKPLLTDNLNKSYILRTFEPNTQVAGHERPKGLYPKLYADDYLVFDQLPEYAEYLQLDLPASAFGGQGTLRFRIPKSMIETK